MDVGLVDDPSYQWGPASSPTIFESMVIVQNDRHKDSFVAAFDLATGKELWRTAHDEYPSWATPTVARGAGRSEIVTNGGKFIRGLDPQTGRELWRLPDDLTQVKVPTPIVAGDFAIVTGGYPSGGRPIYAIRLGGSGELTAEIAGVAYRSRLALHRHADLLRRHPLRLHRRRHPERLRSTHGPAHLSAPRRPWQLRLQRLTRRRRRPSLSRQRGRRRLRRPGRPHLRAARHQPDGRGHDGHAGAVGKHDDRQDADTARGDRIVKRTMTAVIRRVRWRRCRPRYRPARPRIDGRNSAARRRSSARRTRKCRRR